MRNFFIYFLVAIFSLFATPVLAVDYTATEFPDLPTAEGCYTETTEIFRGQPVYYNSFYYLFLGTDTVNDYWVIGTETTSVYSGTIWQYYGSQSDAVITDNNYFWQGVSPQTGANNGFFVEGCGGDLPEAATSTLFYYFWENYQIPVYSLAGIVLLFALIIGIIKVIRVISKSVFNSF